MYKNVLIFCFVTAALFSFFFAKEVPAQDLSSKDSSSKTVSLKKTGPHSRLIDQKVKTVGVKAQKNVRKKSTPEVSLVLSDAECEVIVNFLKQIIPDQNKNIIMIIKTVLKQIGKECLFIPSALAAGLLIGSWVYPESLEAAFTYFKSASGEQRDIGKGLLLSCSSVIVAYILLKVIDKKLFKEKERAEFIKDLIYDLRENNGIVLKETVQA